MGRLLDEDDVIDAICKDCEYYYNENVVQAIKDLPSAQPDVPDICVGNMISRQDAIDVLSLGKEILSRVLDDTDVVGTDREKYSWGIRLIESNIEDIRELPSAQPEKRTDKRTETHECDCIDRQAAINALMAWEEHSVWDEECLKHRGEPYWVAPSDVIKQLPPAQQVLTCKGCKYDYYEYAGCLNCLRRERDLYEPE